MKRMSYLTNLRYKAQIALLSATLTIVLGALDCGRIMATGVLDPSFGQGGKVTTDFGGSEGVSVVLLQPDGKILAVGGKGVFNPNVDCALARYNSDGTLDPLFGTGGKTVTHIPNYRFVTYDAALQPDGKIVVVGRLDRDFYAPAEIFLIRYTADGGLDSGFGNNGTLAISFSHHCFGTSVAIQPDGKIIASAGYGSEFEYFGALVRLNPNGELDLSFGASGRVIEGYPVSQIRLQSDGNILAFVTSHLNGSVNGNVRRYDNDGSRDDSFQAGVGRPFDLLQDGRVVAGSYFDNVSQYKAQRFNINGSIDPTFINDRSFDSPGSICATPDGRIIEVGTLIRGNSRSFIAAAFGNLGTYLGVAVEPFVSGISGASDCVAQPDDKILVIGTTRTAGLGTEDFALVRYSSIRTVPPRQSDFDEDDRGDIAVYRAALTPTGPSYWHILNSSDGSYVGVQFGRGEDRIVPADFDGDGKTNIAVWRPSNGTWYTSTNPAINYGAKQWGITGDVPLPGDFDGDGKADLAVFRPSNGYWYILRSSDNGFVFQQFGSSADKPLMGDFDGDAKSDLAFLRQTDSDLFWHILQSSNNSETITRFGVAGDKIVPVDYDGDGDSNIAVFRPTTGTWYTSTNAATNYDPRNWGSNGDIPVPSDFDGDGKCDVAVFRPGDTYWYILKSSNGTVVAVQWGLSSDLPVPAAYATQ